MNYTTPEKKGILSENIRKYIEILEQGRLSTHSILLMRGNDVFFEKYWEPFDKDFLHRMYSVSKSFVSLSIGFLLQDGLISLEDSMEKYFQTELKNQCDQNIRKQTVKNMLMMSTAKPERNWFEARTDDRVKFYFENDNKETRPGGTVFQYDSTGSFVLGVLTERITGMPFMEYLRKKLFNKIGVSKNAYCLKCPGGHSWGDSGVMCTPMDLLKTARFVMNQGVWNGEQILDRNYLSDATSKMIDNNIYGKEDFNTQGYGYQFWMTYQNSFFFNGMGCQFAICVPAEDMIMVYNGDNQGIDYAKKLIIDNFFEYIVNRANDVLVCECDEEKRKLDRLTNSLKLSHAKGEVYNSFADEINGVVYEMDENPMGIKEMQLVFEGETGKLLYVNSQGNKQIKFGMCKNVYDLFPQEGYSDEIGSVSEKGRFYRCAASAAWVGHKQLFIKVQIIDKYFGNLNINIGFNGEKIGVNMNKSAEDFLAEYQGYAGGTRR